MGIKPGDELKEMEANNNQTELYFLPEPYPSMGEDMGMNVVYSAPNVENPMAFSGIYTDARFINGNEELCKNVRHSMESAIKFIYDNPEETVKIASERFPEISKLTLFNIVRRMLKDEIFPRSVTPKQNEWDSAKEFWGIESKKAIFNECVFRN